MGRARGTRRDEPFRWTLQEDFVGLGHLNGSTTVNGEALGVSADGGVIVGVDDGEAFRWTEESGMVVLEGFPGTYRNARSARAVSADGTVIVGSAVTSSLKTHAFRWTEAGGMEDLGTIPADTYSEARAVSADGSVVVGTSGSRSFVWDAENGMRDIKLVLSTSIDLSGWNLIVAQGVSADGWRITGYGSDPQGKSQAWLAVIPPPEVQETFDAALYFPVQEGDFATVVNGEGYESSSSVLGGYELVNTVPTLVTEGSSGTRSYTTNDEEGVQYHRHFWPGYSPDGGVTTVDRTTTFTPPRLHAEPTFAIGDAIRSIGDATHEYSQGPSETTEYDVTTLIVGHQTVTVPFGTFDALQVLRLGRATGTISGVSIAERERLVTWRVPGLGVVKTRRDGFSIRDGDFFYTPIVELELVDTNRQFVPEPNARAAMWVALATLGVVRCARRLRVIAKTRTAHPAPHESRG